MADEFGKSSGYGLTSTEFLKTVDSNPAPKTPDAPKPPVGWDKKTPPSYQLAHEARK